MSGEMTQTVTGATQPETMMQAASPPAICSVFWRSFTLQGSGTTSASSCMGYAFAMSPALKRIYPGPNPELGTRPAASSGAV